MVNLSIHKRVVAGMLHNPDHGLLRIRDYATAVSRLYTTELQDEVFALIVGDLLSLPKQLVYSAQSSPSLSIWEAEEERLRIAIRKWAKRSETNSDVQSIVERSLLESRYSNTERLEMADFYMRSFPMSQSVMSEQVLNLIDARRKALR